MPLTGIGHYTRNLGLLLEQDSRVDSLLLFAHGKFFSNELLKQAATSNSNAPPRQSILSHVRSSLSSSTSMVSLYQQIMPFAERWRLRHHKDAIFHSPNFLMPAFSGKTVVTIHDLSTLIFPDFHPQARVNFVNKTITSACQKADLIVTDSEFVRNEVIQRYKLEPERIVSQHLGAQEHFKPRTSEQCANSLIKNNLAYKEFFLFVSTLEPRKNLLRILQAYKQYRQECPDGYPLLLVGGSGWQQTSFKDLLVELMDKGWVQSLGYVSDQHLAILFSAARALLFPSIYEGFGLPVLEAMQSGTAVLTSENSSMSEITESAGILVNPLNVEDIAAGIHTLHSNTNIVTALETAGLKRSKAFSWKACSDNMIKHYQNLV